MEVRVVDRLIEEFGSKEEAMHQMALLGGYEERVPDILTFINDPYYLGKTLVKADGTSSVYPIWIDSLQKVYPNPYYTPKVEVYLTGGIGLGKSTMAKIMILYDCCKLLCLKNPQEYFDLLPSTVIRFMLMNATKGLAYDVLFAEIMEWVQNSPFFKSKILERGRTIFIKGIDIGFGSRGNDALGQATVGAIFSEINDMNVVGGQADDNFDTIYTRMNSRFGGKTVPMIGHLILDSSNKGNKSFIDIRIEKKKEEGIDDYLLFRFAHWEAKWHLGGYSGEKFRVYAGDQYRDPFIFEPDTNPAGLEPNRILDVPIEHYQEFKFNIIKSLRDLAGVSTFGTWSFIGSGEIINSLFKHVNPVSVQSDIVLDFFDPEDTLDKYIDVEKLTKINSAPRFIHVDLGLKNDSTGIACSMITGFRDLKKFNPVSGKEVTVRSPLIMTEWTIGIQAKPSQEVPIYKIKNFILESKQKGYPIFEVSTDGYQSSNLRQDLTLAGVSTKLLSVDRTKVPYDNLRNAGLEDRLDLPHNDKLRKEIAELEDTGTKYDHPTDGCFTGDTEIILVSNYSGELCTVKLNELNDDHVNYYSVISKVGDKQLLCEFKNPRITKYVNELLEVEFSDNTIIRCTLDHPILTEIGYVKAIDLDKSQSVSLIRPNKDSKVLVIRKTILFVDNEPVYDITVPSTGNFSLSNFVVVHNSKDRLDAVCGSVHNAIEHLDELGTHTIEDLSKAIDIMSSTGIGQSFKTILTKSMLK